MPSFQPDKSIRGADGITSTTLSWERLTYVSRMILERNIFWNKTPGKQRRKGTRIQIATTRRWQLVDGDSPQKRFVRFNLPPIKRSLILLCSYNVWRRQQQVEWNRCWVQRTIKDSRLSNNLCFLIDYSRTKASETKI